MKRELYKRTDGSYLFTTSESGELVLQARDHGEGNYVLHSDFLQRADLLSLHWKSARRVILLHCEYGSPLVRS
jgi:hypothetical protein